MLFNSKGNRVNTTFQCQSLKSGQVFQLDVIAKPSTLTSPVAFSGLVCGRGELDSPLALVLKLAGTLLPLFNP